MSIMVIFFCLSLSLNSGFVSKEDSEKMGTPRTPKLKELKRTNIDRSLSDSTEQALSAKKTHKVSYIV